MCLLNQRTASHTTDVDLVVKQVDAHLVTGGSTEEITSVEVPVSNYLGEESNNEISLDNVIVNPMSHNG
jgi:hypothetical protein